MEDHHQLLTVKSAHIIQILKDIDGVLSNHFHKIPHSKLAGPFRAPIDPDYAKIRNHIARGGCHSQKMMDFS